MKIIHIMGKNGYWDENGYWEAKPKENSSDTYELRIYRNLEYSHYGCRYQLVSPRNESYQYTTILKTDSKEEMKMTIDLMGLRINQATIFMQEKSNEDTIVPCSIIYLKV